MGERWQRSHQNTSDWPKKNSQAFLILSNELDPQAIDKSICDECYLDLRSFLIDNSHELEGEMDTLKNKKYQKIKEKLNKIAG